MHAYAVSVLRTDPAGKVPRVLVNVADGTVNKADVDAAIQFQLDQASKLAGELSPSPGGSPTPVAPGSR